MIGLEASLAAAAASPRGLYLRSLKAIDGRERQLLDVSPGIFQHLPSQYLTSLSLQLSHYDSTADHLTRLTSLCHLRLRLTDGKPINPLLPMVHHLTQLTSLFLDDNVEKGADLRLLPPQLQQMWAPQTASRVYAGGKLQLSHLTALKSFSRWFIEPNDQLPPNITSLEAIDCSDLDPLLPLQQLRVLTFKESTMGAAELQQLTHILPALQELSLQYDHTELAVAASSAWGHLSPALTSFTLIITNQYSANEEPFPGAILQQQLPLLGSSLQKLSLTSGTEMYNITPGDLAAALATLTALTSLVLEPSRTGWAWAPEEREQQEDQLMAAIAGLGNLRDLSVWGRGGPGALHLTGLTSLKHLSLYCAGVDDAIVSSLVQNMPHLTALMLGLQNPALTGSCLPTVVTQLPKLESISLPAGAATDESLSYLLGCRSLSRLECEHGHQVTYAAKAALLAALPALGRGIVLI
jgi:hypothetical protein